MAPLESHLDRDTFAYDRGGSAKGQRNVVRPEISVIIPAFNAQTTIAEQLGALSRSAVPFDWEVVVCDNGSTDGTADVVSQFTTAIPQLSLIDASARRGPAAARNMGVASAKAPLIAFCDADDVVGPGWLAAARKGLADHAFVAGYRQFLHRRDEAERTGDYLGPNVHPFLPYLPYAGTGNLAIRKDVLLEVGGFDETMRTGEDTDLCWRVQLAGHRLIFLPDMIAYIRSREGPRSCFWQAFSWGADEPQLQHKFALVADAYTKRPPAAAAAARPAEASLPRLGRLAPALIAFARCGVRVLRARGEVDTKSLLFEPGVRLGQLCGRVDRRKCQVPVPDGELPVWPAVE